MKPKLLIIAPAWSQGWWGGGRVLAPPLALPLLAGLTPKEFDIELIDENIEQVDLNAKADLIAISYMTASAPRAYTIADAFRKRQIPVVMGGIHPTVIPDEATPHANAIVIGEAELVWEKVLSDFIAGSLKPRYQSSEYFNMKGMPFPRRDLLQEKRYLTVGVVQTARGCPNGCSFCSVGKVFGHHFRFRPIPEVVEEIRSLKGWVGFVDDNIVGHPRRAKELFEALIPLKIRWIGQGDLSMAKDPELMSLAVKSGCHAMFVGLESVSQKNLHATHKTPNLDIDMDETIGKIHKAGIEIIGSFVLGLDGDDQNTFKATLSFAQKHKLAAIQCSILTPFPGTKMREQLVSEGRVFDHDWSQYTMSNIVFRPLNMTEEELRRGQRFVYDRFYSFPSIIKRSLTLRGKTLLKLGVNWSYHRIGSKDNNKGLTWGLPTKK